MKDKPGYGFWLTLLLGLGIIFTSYPILSDKFWIYAMGIALLVLLMIQLGFSFKIGFANDTFQIQKWFLGFKYTEIVLKYDSYKYYQPNEYFYLYGDNRRISVIYTSDHFDDSISVSEENGKSIAINSNSDSTRIFELLVSRLIKK